jgi:hypothetical protein
VRIGTKIGCGERVAVRQTARRDLQAIEAVRNGGCAVVDVHCGRNDRQAARGLVATTRVIWIGVDEPAASAARKYDLVV